MEQDYLIGGHCIRTEGETLLQALDRINSFHIFKTTQHCHPIGTLCLSETDGPDADTLLYEIEIDDLKWQFGRRADEYVFDILPRQGERLRLWTSGNRLLLHGSLEARLLRFACWMGYGLLTAPLDTVLIHTSVVVHREYAVPFLGESGTGKSTHTRLWLEHIPDSFLLNDDSPILRIINGRPYLYGSPWSGKTPCYKNECYPLAACVRLSQAPFNRIRKLTVPQAYASLHPSCPPAFAYDDRLYEHISHTIEAVLTHVPVFHLECLPNAEAARLSCNTIFGLCEK